MEGGGCGGRAGGYLLPIYFRGEEGWSKSVRWNGFYFSKGRGLIAPGAMGQRQSYEFGGMWPGGI